VVIIGIQPKEISWGTDLSPEVQASIPQVMEMVLKEISSNFIATEVTEITENNKMNKEGETSTP
jgi:Ni,Fe-hydrogenase maturation factor